MVFGYLPVTFLCVCVCDELSCITGSWSALLLSEQWSICQHQVYKKFHDQCGICKRTKKKIYHHPEHHRSISIKAGPKSSPWRTKDQMVAHGMDPALQSSLFAIWPWPQWLESKGNQPVSHKRPPFQLILECYEEIWFSVSLLKDPQGHLWLLICSMEEYPRLAVMIATFRAAWSFLRISTDSRDQFPGRK